MARGIQSALRKFGERRAFGAAKRAAFYADMGRFLLAGISPSQALGAMRQVAAARRRRSLAAIYSRVLTRLNEGQGGRSIASALASEIPGNEVVMLEGAARGGTEALAGAFGEIAKLIDRQVTSARKLRGAVIQSVVRGLTVVVAVAVVMLMVVPQLQASVTPAVDARLGFAKAYFAVGDAFLWAAPLFLAALFAAAVASWWSLPRWRGPRREAFNRHLLPWSFYVRVQATYFLSALAPMLRAGIKMDEALIGMRHYATPWLGGHIQAMLRKLDNGRRGAEVLAGSFFPRDTADRLAIYKELPDFTEVMSRLADDNFRLYEEKIDGLSALVKTLAFVLLALFVLATLLMLFDFATATKAAANAYGV